MNAIVPTPEAPRALGDHAALGPIVMVNLLNFVRDGGREEYERYLEARAPILAKFGARELYFGYFEDLLISDERWDAIAIIEYPSQRAFMQMVRSPEYQASRPIREHALEHSLIYTTTRPKTS